MTVKYQIVSRVIMFEDTITFVIYRNGSSGAMIRHDINCALLCGSLPWDLQTRYHGGFLWHRACIGRDGSNSSWHDIKLTNTAPYVFESNPRSSWCCAASFLFLTTEAWRSLCDILRVSYSIVLAFMVARFSAVRHRSDKYYLVRVLGDISGLGTGD
jgi:hypothetical protein